MFSDYSYDDDCQYIEEEFIGEGSFGEVSICSRRDDTSHKKLAMKNIRKIKRGPMDCYYEDFKLEAEIQSQLKHPNIVELKDSYQTPEQYVIVLEYCKGGTLLDYVVKHGKLSQEVVAAIMTKLLSAVEYMHNMGVVHRDLKLENIVLEN